MDNNDILIRLRYALNLRDKEMVDIFRLGGAEVTDEMIRKLLIKSKETGPFHQASERLADLDEKEENIKCKNSMLEAFLNGLIVFKRGPQEARPEEAATPTLKPNENPNNVLLKKLKIALSLTSEDMMDILKEAGVTITKGELSALLRKEGHKNYKECGDKYARNFLRGLTKRNRG
jgi:uncharacterized protein YehS (DUF1456 family)